MKKILGLWVSSKWHKFLFIQLRIPYLIKSYGKLKMSDNVIKLSNGWVLTGKYYYIMIYEYESWKKTDYLFIKYTKGKVIFDSGAGSGETAMLYVEYGGAKKVICNEVNLDAIKALEMNRNNGKPIEIIAKPFNQQMIIDYKPDFIKMDIEGYEIELFRNDFIKTLKIPTVVEVHNVYMIDKFLENGFKIIRYVRDDSRDLAIMKNFGD